MKPPCLIPDCDRPGKSLGWCGMHYQRVTRYGDPNFVTPPGRPLKSLDRIFDNLTEDQNGCWRWQGGHSQQGYGLVKHDGRRLMVHRVAYERLIGDIPDGLFTDHLCRVRDCANPWHLDPVPNGVNVLRGNGYAARNRRKTHCDTGHPLAGENLLLSGGARVCRQCKRDRQVRRGRTAA